MKSIWMEVSGTNGKQPGKNDVLGRDLTREEMDLSQLEPCICGVTSKEFARGCKEKTAAMEAEMAEYKAKYGKDWSKHWLAHVSPPLDYDRDMKITNTSLYHGSLISNGSKDRMERRALAVEQGHEVCGDDFDLFFDEDGYFRKYAFGDPRMVELLLRWAERTGKWKELPDELQPMYHERNGLGGSV